MFSATKGMLFYNAFQREKISSGNQWIEEVFNRKNGDSFRIAYRIICDENYYGPRCGKTCTPSKQIKCLSDGSVACEFGWHGQNCNIGRFFLYSLF